MFPYIYMGNERTHTHLTENKHMYFQPNIGTLIHIIRFDNACKLNIYLGNVNMHHCMRIWMVAWLKTSSDLRSTDKQRGIEENDLNGVKTKERDPDKINEGNPDRVKLI